MKLDFQSFNKLHKSSQQTYIQTDTQRLQIELINRFYKQKKVKSKQTQNIRLKAQLTNSLNSWFASHTPHSTLHTKCCVQFHIESKFRV